MRTRSAMPTAVEAQLGQEDLALAVGQELVGDAQAEQHGVTTSLVGQDLGHGRAEPAGEHVVLDGGDQPVGAGHRPKARVERLDLQRGSARVTLIPSCVQQPGRLLAGHGQLAQAEQERRSRPRARTSQAPSFILRTGPRR